MTPLGAGPLTARRSIQTHHVIGVRLGPLREQARVGIPRGFQPIRARLAIAVASSVHMPGESASCGFGLFSINGITSVLRKATTAD
jgi:hypothetical protein